ncbi:cupin domain-containing protein [Desulfitobacterium chlororespirans]|uniref:Cupin domain-containing protein n=1 Tax=Desulfitobacterium chlororespirans DSM 11544 TaxID=1121395 RepID=A0A1M7SGB1_9FIRM|nr:cupin domain-containing protein [Desulfitobacterium chlororespirans]SHN57515.1 Cupin domain-containing protein [Desulfitobacterium chlororespirans DSM 11544]
MAGEHLNINEIGWTQIKPGADRITIHGEKCSAVMNKIAFGFPEFYHQHSNEQISYIVRGQCDFTVGEELYHASQGDFILIPSNTIHNATVTGGTECIMLDIFAPVRAEFPPSNKKGYPGSASQ